MSNDAQNRLASVDPGIADAVATLQDHQFAVFDAWEGSGAPSFREPTVRFHGERQEGYRAASIAFQGHLPVRELRRVWQLKDGEMVGPYWELIFHEAVSAPLTSVKEEPQ